ncbi:MAG: 50S ribosomal protein L10 [Candidatus Shikimatogenerans bostrichidophilus]|nr:MAG: 50S ribosomal protein L10 [Candidatus Shikimatogenerans bostrichidophilus]
MININKKKKIELINKLFIKYNYFYIIDISKFKSNLLFNFRKDCYNNKIKFLNIKNTLLKKFLIIKKKKKILKIIKDVLINNTFIMFTNNINNPAKIIKKNKIFITNKYYPIFKAAYVNKKFYIGEKKLNILCNIKSKEELIINILLGINNKINNFIFNIINYNIIKIILIIKNLKKK